ncbi:hypothetical protein [Niabella beijingensis]|uniref:hypothetical protein n=1 Tax=Niabella beijingensis TaxID=2872700 RepID=UPI001CBB8B75|nr:hypothetical protein [Niabella beijingensis]MBZ4192674.1 hypothetical protein [Niabella beijingensis]
MGFFGRTEKDKKEQQQETPLAQRLQVFLDKLSERAQSLYDEVRATAQEVADADNDPFKRSFLQFKSGILAQFNGILQKGNDTFHTQVTPKAGMMESAVLSVRFNDWHSKVLNLMVTVFDGISERDLEKEYAAAMEAYDHTKDSFQCHQCGSRLEIDRFYFIATYITCPHCRTQNTFDPGTKAKMVELLARPLAEQRCRDLKTVYERIRGERGAGQAFESYQQYTRALIAEMDKILPGLEEQHQNFYNRLISDYRQFEILED